MICTPLSLVNYFHSNHCLSWFSVLIAQFFDLLFKYLAISTQVIWPGFDATGNKVFCLLLHSNVVPLLESLWVIGYLNAHKTTSDDIPTPQKDISDKLQSPFSFYTFLKAPPLSFRNLLEVSTSFSLQLAASIEQKLTGGRIEVSLLLLAFCTVNLD